MRSGHLLAAFSSRLSSGTGGGNGASQDTPCGYDFSQMCAMRILPVRSCRSAAWSRAPAVGSRTHSKLILQELLHRPVRLIDRGIVVGGGASIGVGDRNAAETRPAKHVRRRTFRPVRVKQRIVFVGVTMRPAVDGDRRDISFGVEPAGAKDVRQLAANVAFESCKARAQDIELPRPVLIALG